MPRLRVACLINRPDRIESWAERLLVKISDMQDVELVAILKTPNTPNPSGGNILLSMVSVLERPVFAKTAHTSKWPLSEDMNCDIICASDLDKIKALNLDVILDLEFSEAAANLAPMTRFGTWFIDIFRAPKNTIGFWAAAGREAVSEIGLLRYDGQALKPKVLATYALNPKFIATRNAHFMKQKSPDLISRELARLSMTGEITEIDDAYQNQHISPDTKDVIKYLGRVLMECFRRLSSETAARMGHRPDMFFFKVGTGTALSFDPASARDILPAGNEYWADPFLWEKDGTTYCFFETYDYKTNTGRISAGRFEGDDFIVLGDALHMDYHLSFPFLFEHENDIYMLPETHEARRIEIWRCTDFPLKWERHTTALEGKDAADTVLFNKDGNWWVFTNIASGGFSDNCSELHIFQVDSPDMNAITPHALNPVILDTRTARNGGRIHEIDGRLYRISQDNAHGQYGYGLNVMEITNLSLTEYTEKQVRQIGPGFEAGITGCHHFDAIGDHFIMDVQTRRGGRG